jgi:hypothetical protein
MAMNSSIQEIKSRHVWVDNDVYWLYATKRMSGQLWHNKVHKGIVRACTKSRSDPVLRRNLAYVERCRCAHCTTARAKQISHRSFHIIMSTDEFGNHCLLAIDDGNFHEMLEKIEFMERATK